MYGFSFKQVITGEKTLGENVAVEIQSILTNIEDNYIEYIQTYSVFMEGRNEIWKDTIYSTTGFPDPLWNGHKTAERGR